MIPTTSAEDLQKLTRKELQALAKNYGIKGNASNAILIEKIEIVLLKKDETIVAKDVTADAIIVVEEKASIKISDEPFKVGEVVLIISSNSHGVVKRTNKTTLRIIEDDGNERTVQLSDCTKLVTSSVSFAEPVLNTTVSDPADQSLLIEHKNHVQTQIAVSDNEEPFVHATNIEQSPAQENLGAIMIENATTSAAISVAVTDKPFCNNDSAIYHTKDSKKSSSFALNPRSNRAEEIRRKANIARALPSSSGSQRRETKTAASVKRTPLSVAAVNPMRKKITSSTHGASTAKTSASSFTGKSCKDYNKSIFKSTTNNDNVIPIDDTRLL